MNDNIVKGKNKELNRILNENDMLYNNYAHYCGLSASSLWILYILHENNEIYMQNDISKMICLPKQTVNSAIAKLIKKGYIELEHIEATRNGKAVKLTKEGKIFAKKIIIPLTEAEESSFSSMSKTEIDTFFELLNKLSVIFKNKLENIYKKSKKR